MSCIGKVLGGISKTMNHFYLKRIKSHDIQTLLENPGLFYLTTWSLRLLDFSDGQGGDKNSHQWQFGCQQQKLPFVNISKMKYFERIWSYTHNWGKIKLWEEREPKINERYRDMEWERGRKVGRDEWRK